MIYRKKPVEIEAIQWTGENQREMFNFLTDYEKTDEYMTASGKNFYIDHSKVKGGLIIRTLEGEHIASIGDYIIKGVAGEFYPCKPDIFTRTYSLAETGAMNPECYDYALRLAGKIVTDIELDYGKRNGEMPMLSKLLHIENLLAQVRSDLEGGNG